MDFSGIAGQKEVIGNLLYSLENDKISHAYIFSGPAGIGKRTVARIFAGILLCSGRKESGSLSRKATGSCGECQPCRLFEAGSNPDFYEIEAAGATIGVDEIRDLQGHMAVKPFYGERKVYLVAEADKMTVQAQNCLLKTLEEPPSFAVIILTVSNYDALLETIRSRAVKYSFRENSREEVLGFLERKFGDGLKEKDFIASYSGGIIGKALELAGNEEFIALREETLKIAEGISRSGLYDVFRAYDFFNNNKDHAETILDIMASYYRDLLVAKNAGKEKLLINSDKKDIIINNARDFEVRKLVKNIETIELTRLNIRKNVNFQLSIEVMLMKLQED